MFNNITVKFKIKNYEFISSISFFLFFLNSKFIHKARHAKQQSNRERLQQNEQLQGTGHQTKTEQTDQHQKQNNKTARSATNNREHPTNKDTNLDLQPTTATTDPSCITSTDILRLLCSAAFRSIQLYLCLQR